MPDLSERRVAVTGGAGFIGSSLVAELLAQGARVVVLDSLVNGSRENLDDALAAAGLSEEGLELQVGDVRDPAALEKAFAGAEIVFHLACLGVRHSLHAPLENHEVNAGGTLRALEAARVVECSRFVMVSTSEVYGTAQQVPMTEDHPTRPHTVYGASKLAAEHYAIAYQRCFGLPVVVLRPFNSFGPRCHHEGDSGEVIPRFLLRALAGQPPIVFGDGSQTRDFTYVEDTARGIVEVGLHPDASGQVVNLGSQGEVRIDELARTILELTGRQDLQPVHQDPRPGDVLRLYADGTLARDAFGFTPRVSLRDGIERLPAWYERRGVDPAELLAAEQVRSWEP